MSFITEREERAIGILLKVVKLELMEFDRMPYQKKPDPAAVGILQTAIKIAESAFPSVAIKVQRELEALATEGERGKQ